MIQAKIPFKYLHHLICAPVNVSDSADTTFIFDSGIGINLISKELCSKVSGCEPTGKVFSGKRMSGQEVKCDLVNLSSISLGTLRVEKVPAGILELNLSPDFSDIGGFLSLQFFEKTRVTVSYKTKELIFETEESIIELERHGKVIPIELERNGPSIDSFLDLRLPGGKVIKAEVDSGSDALILNSKFMEDLRIDRESKEVKKVVGSDETGHEYARYFTRIEGPISLQASIDVSQRDLDVVFQDIIYDALIGDSFLKRYSVTYDIPRSRMLFTSVSASL
jgi:hypothetical protein